MIQRIVSPENGDRGVVWRGYHWIWKTFCLISKTRGSARQTANVVAIQKIIEDQDVKLVVLAESIVSDRLNPMDRWLVIKSQTELGRFVVIEGNRRLAALRILNNPAVLKDLEVRSPVKKRLEDLAQQFDLDTIGKIDCFEVADSELAPVV